MARKKSKILRITQIRSRIGCRPQQKATLDALGLKRINQSVEHQDNPMIRGMINKVIFLLNVEKAS